MKNSILIKNARVVTPGGIMENCSVLSAGGKIEKIGSFGQNGAEIVIDGEHKFLLPGFIDLHSDCIETEIEQRPGNIFPTNISIVELDKRNVSSGVTTPYYSLSFSGDEIGLRNNNKAREIILEIIRIKKHLMADAKIHFRFEITATEAIPILEELVHEGIIDLVSLMDHTPGQGQFRTDEDYRNYYGKKYRKSEEAMNKRIEEKKRIRASQGRDNIDKVIKICLDHSVPLASHDDDTEEKITGLREKGVGITEFPVNLEAAMSARDKGIYVMLGAPNILKGGSHAKNLSALDAMRNNCGNVICSDYMVTAILYAVFKLAGLKIFNLSGAVNLVSLNPARAAGLDKHKGSIEEGKDADFILVDDSFEIPMVEKVFIKGRQVYGRAHK